MEDPKKKITKKHKKNIVVAVSLAIVAEKQKTTKEDVDKVEKLKKVKNIHTIHQSIKQISKSNGIHNETYIIALN